MPGHKGIGQLNCEKYDITEVKDADSLYEAEGIICLSEKNASELFGCDTYYSTEGSSHCIRTMLFLLSLYAKEKGLAPTILSARNVHKSFLSAVSLTDIEVEWLYSSNNSYLSCNINAVELDAALNEMSVKPVALYLTSPDYLGNVLDIASIAEVCHKHGILLIVDNAHGAYLKFLKSSLHPVDCGADMCCASAHKTLPVLTGGAYLQLSDDLSAMFKDRLKDALGLFGSTSPSYLTLASLDLANKYIAEGYETKLNDIIVRISYLKSMIKDLGIELLPSDPLKITFKTKSYGYTGFAFADLLRTKNIECEFADNDFVVLMLSPENDENDLNVLKEAIVSVPKGSSLVSDCPIFEKAIKSISVKEAIFSLNETVNVAESQGRILADTCVSCPPAVPVLMPGEVITDESIKIFEYYGIYKLKVVK